MNVLNEYRSRREWLAEAKKQVEAGELSVQVAEHVLQRYMRNPIKCAVSYSDIDNIDGYSDTGEHQAQVQRERAGYFADIAALQAAISKHREAEKYKGIIGQLEALARQHEATGETVRKRIDCLESAVDLMGYRTPRAKADTTKRTWPKEFEKSNGLIRYVLERFADDGTISRDGDLYKWEAPKEHLWFFVVIANHRLGLISTQSDRIKWKPFQMLFGIPEQDINNARSKRASSVKNPLELKPADVCYYIFSNFDKYVAAYKAETLASSVKAYDERDNEVGRTYA